MIINVLWASLKYRLLLSDFNDSWNFSNDFRKIRANIIFMKTNPREAQLFHADGWTDSHDVANSCYS